MKPVKQTSFSKVILLAMLVGGIAGTGLLAAETAPAPNDAEAKTKVLEDRVKQLEKRLAEMEAKEHAAPSQHFGMQQDDFNKLFDQMRKQMMEHGNAFGLDDKQVPAPGGARGIHKPTLGVGVEELTDELKARFKNDVKEGVFVMSVYPHSPAEKAGVMVGDAITSFDGKAIVHPIALIDAVKSAAKGNHELLVARHGEMIKFKVDLGSQDAAMNGMPLITAPGHDANKVMRTELKVSSLELTDALSTELALSTDQRKKMTDVLALHAKALSEEFGKINAQTPALGFAVTSELTELAKKHADNAAKDLVGVLTPEQLKKWNEYRATHSSISFSQSMQLGTAGTGDQTFGFDPLNDEDETPSPTVKF